MDKTTYLNLKKQREREAVSYSRESYCFNCDRLKRNCLCALITPFQTRAHFVFLMHPKEARREKIGTGKITQRFLLNSRLLVGVDFTDHAEVNALISDPGHYCAVLYPGKAALNISDHGSALQLESLCKEKRLVLFILDGTWPCAKKMMRLSQNLRRLPRLSFATKYTSIFEIKEQPDDFCLSTLESIRVLLKESHRHGLEDTDQQEDQMLTVFKTMIEYQKSCATDATRANHRGAGRGFRKREERSRPKKWLTRNIFLQD